MSERTFYREQAEHCAAAAAQATLQNEKDKFLAAEKAWRNLADGPIARAARLGGMG
jgi:hypothetical protein